MAYLTTAQLVAAMPNTTAAITPTVDQNATVSMADTCGGYDGIRATAQMPVSPTSAWAKFSAALTNPFASPLPPANFIMTGHTSQTLTSCPTLFGLSPNLPLVGGAMGTTRIDWNSAGSGAIIFTPLQGAILRDAKFVGGCVIFDFGAITTVVPLVVMDGLYCDSISCILRDGSIANGLTRKLNKLLFRRNYLHSNDRGLFFNGNGASRVWEQENHVDLCGRFGLFVGPATPAPQQQGYGDFLMVTNNLVERMVVSQSSANNNPYITFGRYAALLGNIAANAIYSGVPTQHDFEPYYNKLGVAALIGNVQVDAGAGQGMFTLKGGARTNTDNSAGGWDYVCLGNVGLKSPLGNYEQPGIWIQSVDDNISCNVIETTGNYGFHVNKMTAGVPEEHLTNLMIHDNHFISRSGGNAGIAEGAHKNLWINGNICAGFGGASQGLAFRIATLSHGAASNYRLQGNTAWHCYSSAAARTDCIHVKTDNATDSFTQSLPLSDNVLDVSDAPDNSACYGITFEGTGDIQNCVVDGNNFVGFVTNPIRNLNSGGNRSGKTLTILNNPGFTNENTGTGTIVVGQASVTITHGLTTISNMNSAPDPTDIFIQPTSVLNGGHQIRVTAITETTFDVVTDAAITTANFTFAWRVRKTKWVFD